MTIRISSKIIRRMTNSVREISKAGTVAEIYGAWVPRCPESLRRAMEKRLGQISQ